MHQEQNSSVLALSMGPWKYQMVLTSKQRAQHKDAVLVAQICILKYSRHCMQTDMLSVASLSLSIQRLRSCRSRPAMVVWSWCCMQATVLSGHFVHASCNDCWSYTHSQWGVASPEPGRGDEWLCLPSRRWQSHQYPQWRMALNVILVWSSYWWRHRAHLHDVAIVMI